MYLESLVQGIKSHHLSMKEEGSLFCFVVMRFIEPGCFRLCSWCLWKALDRRGAWAWFHWCLVLAVQKFLNIEWFFHWKLNYIVAENFWGIGMLLERSWWAGFNGIYSVRFGFKMLEILNFKWILPLKIQINSKKPGFGRKNQLRTKWIVLLQGAFHFH